MILTRGIEHGTVGEEESTRDWENKLELRSSISRRLLRNRYRTGAVVASRFASSMRPRIVHFTEVPTPGLSGMNGGRSKVWRVDLASGERMIVHEGDPEPTDVTVARNRNVYWTCTVAGVIVEAKRLGGR